MANFVEEVYIYDDTIGRITDKARYAFECLMEVVNVPYGIEVDNLYYAKQFAEFCGGTFPSAVLTALVKRGLLHCDGKVDGLNAYAITTEIYDYYKNTYMPTKEHYKADLDAYFSRKG